ncbi:MAG: hypothetical protein II142_00255 [Bacteroidales bacterium]|nr:hypothetical protein [Bacteroidales bacterium]
MKRIILFFAMLLSITTFAQQPKLGTRPAIDIKWFEGKTPEQIISEYGTPPKMNLSGFYKSDYLADFALLYEHFHICLNELSEGSRQGYVAYFATDSPDFVVLSDIYPGGIRVGGKISDLQAFNFAASAKSHKGDRRNNLKEDPLTCGFENYPESYSIYSLEYNWIGIEAENGIIKAWGYFSKEDIDEPGTNEVTIPMVAQ